MRLKTINSPRLYFCVTLLVSCLVVLDSAIGSLTLDERQKIADIARSKPWLDLEIDFDFRSLYLDHKNIDQLNNLGLAISSEDLKGSTFLIGGHTSPLGDQRYEFDLSEARARVVKNFLVENFDIDPDTLVAVGYGAEQLKNTSDPNSPENERVQIVNLEQRAPKQHRQNP